MKLNYIGILVYISSALQKTGVKACGAIFGPKDMCPAQGADFLLVSIFLTSCATAFPVPVREEPPPMKAG